MTPDNTTKSLLAPRIRGIIRSWIAFNGHGTPMRLRIQFVVMLVASLCLCTTSVSRLNGQADDDKVYTVDQVDVKAKIKNKLENLPQQPSDCPAKVQVTLRIVLRKSGSVTDVTVVNSSGCSYDHEAVKAVQKLKFDPATKAGQQVSQYLNFEYRVGDQ